MGANARQKVRDTRQRMRDVRAGDTTSTEEWMESKRRKPLEATPQQMAREEKRAPAKIYAWDSPSPSSEQTTGAGKLPPLESSTAANQVKYNIAMPDSAQLDTTGVVAASPNSNHQFKWDGSMSSEVTPTEQAQVQTPYSAIMNGDAAVPATSTFSASINPVAALSTSNELTGRVGPSAEEIAGLGK